MARHKCERRYAFIWPRDKSGNRARWRDAWTGRGPNIYIASAYDRTPGAGDGPTRRRWTNCPDAESNEFLRAQDAVMHRGALGRVSQRSAERIYDFKRRKYCRPYEGMWTDAMYLPYSTHPIATEFFPYFNEPSNSQALVPCLQCKRTNWKRGDICTCRPRYHDHHQPGHMPPYHAITKPLQYPERHEPPQLQRTPCDRRHVRFKDHRGSDSDSQTNSSDSSDYSRQLS